MDFDVLQCIFIVTLIVQTVRINDDIVSSNNVNNYNPWRSQYSYSYTHTDRWIKMESFANRGELLRYLTNNPNQTNNSAFEGIRKYIQFSMTKTKIFMQHDQQTKAIFFGWKLDAVFHFLQNFINVMVAIPAFRRIVITHKIAYNYNQSPRDFGVYQFKTHVRDVDSNSVTRVSTSISSSTEAKYNNDKRRSGWDLNSHDDHYLVCPLPGDLVFVCQRFLVNDHMITWSAVRFYTVNELCKTFNQPCDGKFKQDLINMFNDMTRIEKCFDKDNIHFKNYFCDQLKPHLNNIELVTGLQMAIDHYLQCQRQRCHICANPRKKQLIQRIQTSLDMKSNGNSVKPNDCGNVITHILQQVSQYFEAKYQIIATKRGTLAVEIVLFCYLGNDIVGVPITLNRDKTKWMIRTILVSEMKHNTMLPQLLLGTNPKYKLCVLILYVYMLYSQTLAIDLFFQIR